VDLFGHVIVGEAHWFQPEVHFWEDLVGEVASKVEELPLFVEEGPFYFRLGEDEILQVVEMGEEHKVREEAFPAHKGVEALRVADRVIQLEERLTQGG